MRVLKSALRDDPLPIRSSNARLRAISYLVLGVPTRMHAAS